MVFPVVMYECKSWTIKKAEHQRIGSFEPWCWRRLWKVPWTARKSNQWVLKESVLNILWQDWCWKWNSNTLPIWGEELIHWKRPWCWERLRAGGDGGDRELDGWVASSTLWTEFEQAPGDSEGQGSLVCYSPWGCKKSDMTELSEQQLQKLNNNDNKRNYI